MSDTAMKEKMEKLEEILIAHKDIPGGLMPVLHETQELFGYLPEEAQKRISEYLNIPLAEIYGVATFYSRFTLNPRGENVISVCLGTACYVRGGKQILEKLEKELEVGTGGTTPDRKFSLEINRCVGACGLAPVVTVGADIYRRVKLDKIPSIVGKYRNGGS
jgi:NADH:ubiquinone oxidoreductase subunit E